MKKLNKYTNKILFGYKTKENLNCFYLFIKDLFWVKEIFIEKITIVDKICKSSINYSAVITLTAGLFLALFWIKT